MCSASFVLALRALRWVSLLVRDGYPVSRGHSLAIPKRHVESWFDTTYDERADLTALIDEARRIVSSELAPAASNIGIDDGVMGGQTVPYLHVDEQRRKKHLWPFVVGALFFVNRYGGPDRRFKSSRQLQTCLYSRLNLSTASGLDIRLLGSRERGVAPLSNALAQTA